MYEEDAHLEMAYEDNQTQQADWAAEDQGDDLDENEIESRLSDELDHLDQEFPGWEGQSGPAYTGRHRA